MTVIGIPPINLDVSLPMLCTKRTSYVAVASIACKQITYRVDEYFSPRMCYHCVKQGREQLVGFLQRPPVVPVQDTTGLDNRLEKVLRVVGCPFYNHVFRRAGTLQTIWCLLRYMCYNSSNAHAALSSHRDVKNHPGKARLRFNHPCLRDIRVKERLRLARPGLLNGLLRDVLQGHQKDMNSPQLLR